MCLITPIDIAKARSKWHGVDVPQGIRWQHSDSEFYQRISVEGAIGPDLLRDFAMRNQDEIPSRRTGGYSIIRSHWGGADYWADKLGQHFRSPNFVAAREQAGAANDPEPTINLVTDVAGLIGRSPRTGAERCLGISAASKWLFFYAPELPVFIYDSVARLGLLRRDSAVSYDQWWQACAQWYSPFVDDPPIDGGEIPEPRVHAGWFSRRCLDLASYRHGQMGQPLPQPPCCYCPHGGDHL